MGEAAVALLRDWYVVLSQLSAAVGEPLSRAASGLQIPILSALLFGVIGATAPCQLTTNLSAIAYVSRGPEDARPWAEALAYTLGKALVYTAAGAAAIGLGLGLQDAALPVVAVARRLLGPFLLVVGLVFLGLVRVPASFGGWLAERIRRRTAARGPWGAFLLGVAFAFAFCPTLFLLFFGLTIPLGLASNGGLLLPAVFAVGTALPLLAYAALLAAGNGLAPGYARRLADGHAVVRRVAGGIFVLAGINDTLTYWAL